MNILYLTQSPVHFREFLIRPWQPQDRDATAAVVRSVLTEYGLPWQPESVDRDVLEVEEFYHAVGGELWVIEYQGQLVGSGGYYPIDRHPDSVELRKMYIRPEVRGKGLGRFMLQLLEGMIAARGFEAIWIETSSTFKEAVRLYERNGYCPPPNPSCELTTQRCDQVFVKRLRR